MRGDGNLTISSQTASDWLTLVSPQARSKLLRLLCSSSCEGFIRAAAVVVWA